jgi:hypothetical protein
MIFSRTSPTELPFNPHLSPTGEVKMLFWVYPNFSESTTPPLTTMGVASNGFGLLFLTGRGETSPPPSGTGAASNGFGLLLLAGRG